MLMGMKSSLTHFCLSDNLTKPGCLVFSCSALFHRAALCFLSLSLQAVGEGKHQNKLNPKGFLSPGIRKRIWTLSFLCLHASYTHPAWVWVWLQHLTMLQVCAPAHTHQNATMGRREHLPLMTPSRLRLIPRFFICHFLISSLVLSLSFGITGASVKLVTSPNTHISKTSTGRSCIQGHRARGQLIPPMCLGHPGKTAEKLKLSIISVCQPGHVILQTCICECHM